MSELVVNGIDLSGYIALDEREVGWRRLADIEIGGRSRAYGGGARNAVRAKKRVAQLRTVPRTQQEAEALRGLLGGEGQTWDFDSSLYSSGKGLGPAASGGVVTYNTGGGVFGSAYMSTTGYLEFEVGTLPGYTLLLIAQPAAFGFARCLIRSDGLLRRDGVVQASLAAMYGNGDSLHYFSGTRLGLRGRGINAVARANSAAVTLGTKMKQPTVAADSAFFECTTAGNTAAAPPVFNEGTGAPTTDGTVVWTARGPWRGVFDQVILLPFAVPDAWLTSIEAELAARYWTAQPRLRVTGDLVPNAPWTMDGKFDGSRIVPIASGTGLSVTHEVLDFTLEES